MEFLYLFIDYINLNIKFNFFYTFLIFFIFLIIYNSICLPGNIILFISAGYFFGIYLGFILSIFSIVFGSFFFFLFSSILIKRFPLKMINKYSNKIDLYIKNTSFEYLIIFRIIPGLPLILQNLFLSILHIKKITFLFSSLIGFTPFVFVTVYIGSELRDINNLDSISFSDIFSFKFLLFISLLIFFLFFRVFLKRKN